MPKTIDITKGIESFDDRTDFSRNNQDRKPYGKSNGADALHIGSEYDVAPAPEAQPTPAPQTAAPPAPPAEKPKFTHKLANGETLEAESVEALAAAIEKSLSQQKPAVVEFEDRPVYQPLEFKRKELSLQEQASILNVWKENPQKAMRMLQEAEYGTTLESVLAHLNQAELREFHRRQDEAALDFMGECETYNPTPANSKKLTEYLKSKGKPITKQNLVLSFQQLVAAGDKSLLRKVDEQPPAASAEANETDLTEIPPPPTVVPSGTGMPEPPKQVDADKFAKEFASWPLHKQQAWFADQKRKRQ